MAHIANMCLKPLTLGIFMVLFYTLQISGAAELSVSTPTTFEEAVKHWTQYECVYPDQSLYSPPTSIFSTTSANPPILLQRCLNVEKLSEKKPSDEFVYNLCKTFYIVSFGFCDHSEAISPDKLKPGVLANSLDYTHFDVCDYAGYLAKSLSQQRNSIEFGFFIQGCDTFCSAKDTKPLCHLLVNGLCQYFKVCDVKRVNQDQGDDNIAGTSGQSTNQNKESVPKSANKPSSNSRETDPAATSDNSKISNSNSGTAPLTPTASSVSSNNQPLPSQPNSNSIPGVINDGSQNSIVPGQNQIITPDQQSSHVGDNTETKSSTDVNANPAQQSTNVGDNTESKSSTDVKANPAQQPTNVGDNTESKSSGDINANPAQQPSNVGDNTESKSSGDVNANPAQQPTNFGDNTNTESKPSNGNSIGEKNKNKQTKFQRNEEDGAPSSGHFFAYFLTAVVFCISGYVIFHNKKKIMAFIVEGRSGVDSGRRRGNGNVQYSKLSSNVEEVMPSLDKETSSKNFVY